MASSSTRKQCANNNGCKQAAVTNCEGCSKAFCIKHIIDHRRLLDEEMNVIIDEHDYLKNMLNQQTTKPDSHPLIKEIDQWEKESIAKIQKRAHKLRQELFQSTAAYTSDLSKKLQQLSEQLKRGREHDDFIETDLQDWKKTLENLKTNLISPSTISINRDDNVSLVHNISITSFVKTSEEFERLSDNGVRIEERGQVIIHDALDDYTEIRGKNEYVSGSHKILPVVTNEEFEKVSDKEVRIKENGQVAVRDGTLSPTEVRGKNEYRSGRHEIRVRIEESSGTWMFLGINSKVTPLRCYSHTRKSAYGWSSNNYIWLKGSEQLNISNPRIEMKMNDVITLTLDCDNRKISMLNERTKAEHELIVDINNCPFPWQLHLNLYEPQDSVRIL
jgi:hypothetical protein